MLQAACVRAASPSLFPFANPNIMQLILWILRAVFFLVSVGLAVSLISGIELHQDRWVLFMFFTVGALLVVIGDLLIPRKRIDLISSVYFGLLIGLLLTYILKLALDPLFLQFQGRAGTDLVRLRVYESSITIFLAVAFCYICISVLWQTKDDFRFVIPYVEFRRELKGLKPLVLDTSAVIDGRIADIVETGLVDQRLVIPRFALSELQNIADSSDKLRRARGRRGLDILNRLRGDERIELEIFDQELPDADGQPVDHKLVAVARHLNGKIVTGDFNLNKVARLQNIPVINLNDIANALKSILLPGEKIRIKLVKAGENAGQGVGYLEDGTMIVVEDGRSHVGQLVEVTVTSMLQTSAGRMVFARYESVIGRD
jgi:uncharacterized protein YacL